jgi:hypothetical protein
VELLDRFGPLFTDSRGDSTWAILYSGLKLLHLLGMGLITATFIGEYSRICLAALTQLIAL